MMSLYLTYLFLDPRTYFYTIANFIGTDWTKLAAKLDLDINVNIIKAENVQIFDQVIEFLKKWFDKNHPRSTATKLKKTLHEIDKSFIANMICNIDVA